MIWCMMWTQFNFFKFPELVNFAHIIFMIIYPFPHWLLVISALDLSSKMNQKNILDRAGVFLEHRTEDEMRG